MPYGMSFAIGRSDTQLRRGPTKRRDELQMAGKRIQSRRCRVGEFIQGVPAGLARILGRLGAVVRCRRMLTRLPHAIRKNGVPQAVECECGVFNESAASCHGRRLATEPGRISVAARPTCQRRCALTLAQVAIAADQRQSGRSGSYLSWVTRSKSSRQRARRRSYSASRS